ncbi:MAG TPA: transposase [Candidatus Dormibacteraeota bacterium]|nr:transposase [Candidatus Dormibacteraeota bacterium]
MIQSGQSPRGWHSRGYLPHFDGGELAQFITFRLYDSLPHSVVARWREELRFEKPSEVEAMMRRRIEAYLDQGHGSCFLKDFAVATMVQNALLFHDRVKYLLAAWNVMPNHVHMLCTPINGFGLGAIMHSLKSYTSNEANKILGRRSHFWQKEYFDRYIRNARHFAKAVEYIENNPVKANLREKASDLQ